MSQQEVNLRGVRISGRVEIAIKGEPSHCYCFEGALPPEVQTMFENILGNGQLRVSCTKDKKVGLYSTSVGASFTISASCHQSTPGETNAANDPFFHEAARLVKHYAQHYTQEAFLEAEAELRSMLQQRGKPDLYPF